MAPATVHKLRPRQSTAGLRCSQCGASAKAACNCGAAYVPAGQLAAKAAASGKSNRAVADELGVSKDTVRRARKATGANAPVDRVGKDGKVRRLPKPKAKAPLSLTAQVNKMVGPPALLARDYISELEEWLATKPALPEDAVVTLLNVLHLCAESCERLAELIEKQFPNPNGGRQP